MHLPANVQCAVDPACLPWVPLGPGKAFKPLAFLRGDRGFVELLRLDPGTHIPLHRHSGEVHAFNLRGSRRLDTGELIGPGGYVHEPAGNIDSWTVAGDEPLELLVVVMGVVEYLSADHQVSDRFDASRLDQCYRAWCAQAGVSAVDRWC